MPPLAALLWLAWGPAAILACGSLDALIPPKIASAYNHSCGWAARPRQCLNQLPPGSHPPVPTGDANCHCYLGICNYFSFIDGLQLPWGQAKLFCQCLGGSLVSIYTGDTMSALSYYTLGLIAGLGGGGNQNPANSELSNCYNHLTCVKEAKIREGNTAVCSRLAEGHCRRQLLWVDQLHQDGEQCGGLGVWAGDKFWLPCSQKIGFVCVAAGSAVSVSQVLLLLLLFLLLLYSYFSL
jgi:hypothetical protein